MHLYSILRNSHALRAHSPSQLLSRTHSRRRRSTLSKIWMPSGGSAKLETDSGHDKLIRAGFLRQSQAGIFQYLPMGLRVQKKIEKLICKHMESIGASRLELSTITSEDLWKKSDRLDHVAPELFRLQDRKNVPLMLSPTHEEEITALVASTVTSYKDLPLRLYQITRKYRDEMRSRQGLLRSREFLMKDLYTFDTTPEAAVNTYQKVQEAYKAIFNELGMPILIAEASSGQMGGNRSHEYHLADSIGEDTIAHCSSCGYTANEEVAMSRPVPLETLDITSPSSFGLWRGITKDRKTLVNAWYPQTNNSVIKFFNIHMIKDLVPELDSGVHDPMPLWRDAAANTDSTIVNVVDYRLMANFEMLRRELPIIPEQLPDFAGSQSTKATTASGQELNLLKPAEGDGCPRCEYGELNIKRSIELGHTFYLGTRYSKPLGAYVSVPGQSQHTLVQMGCFGIGVSRILGAVAESMMDSRGLNWPKAIAPFEVVVIPSSSVNNEALVMFDSLTKEASFDAVFDDREKSFGWKMRDADMLGYPVVVILGKAWRERGVCEVQCRRLDHEENVAVERLPDFLKQLLHKA